MPFGSDTDQETEAMPRLLGVPAEHASCLEQRRRHQQPRHRAKRSRSIEQGHQRAGRTPRALDTCAILSWFDVSHINRGNDLKSDKKATNSSLVTSVQAL